MRKLRDKAVQEQQDANGKVKESKDMLRKVCGGGVLQCWQSIAILRYLVLHNM